MCFPVQTDTAETTNTRYVCFFITCFKINRHVVYQATRSLLMEVVDQQLKKRVLVKGHNSGRYVQLM